LRKSARSSSPRAVACHDRFQRGLQACLVAGLGEVDLRDGGQRRGQCLRLVLLDGGHDALGLRETPDRAAQLLAWLPLAHGVGRSTLQRR
jgi:hypothetical protein